VKICDPDGEGVPAPDDGGGVITPAAVAGLLVTGAAKGAAASLPMIVLSASATGRASPHWAQRAAKSGLLALQREQIMIGIAEAITRIAYYLLL